MWACTGERGQQGRSVCARACPTRDQALEPQPGQKEETQKRQMHDDSLCHRCESVWIITISGSERSRQKLEVSGFQFVGTYLVQTVVRVCSWSEKSVKAVLRGLFSHFSQSLNAVELPHVRISVQRQLGCFCKLPACVCKTFLDAFLLIKTRLITNKSKISTAY